MRVLILGGTGLISTSITRQLVERGDDVTVFNRGQRESRIPEGVRSLTGDRKDYDAFEKMMAFEEWDGVIDMIGFVPEDAQSDIRAFHGKTRRFVFCSTVCVYNGRVTKTPATDDEPLNPLSDYGKNKAACENILMEAFAEQGFPTTILRPSHTYGEGGSIIHSLGWTTTFLDRVRKNKKVIVHGDGKTLWASCHIDDVARAFVGALDNDVSAGQSYHVTGDDPQSWDDYVASVAEVIGGSPEIVHIPTDILVKLAPKRAAFTGHEFQYNRIFDNSKAKRDLGFEYTIPWKEGVQRTVEWLDSRGKIENSDTDPFDDCVIGKWEELCGSMLDECGETEG
jgi:nucleoside-diphosphate-sugar epimerase